MTKKEMCKLAPGSIVVNTEAEDCSPVLIVRKVQRDEATSYPIGFVGVSVDSGDVRVEVLTPACLAAEYENADVTSDVNFRQKLLRAIANECDWLNEVQSICMIN